MHVLEPVDAHLPNPRSPSPVSPTYLEGLILVGYLGALFLGPPWAVLGGRKGHHGQLGALQAGRLGRLLGRPGPS